MTISKTFIVNVRYEANKEVLTEEAVADVLIDNMESLEDDGEIYELVSVRVKRFDQGESLLG